MKNRKKRKLDIKNILIEYRIPHIMVVASILAAYFVFVKSDLLTFISFVLLIIPFTYFKFDGRLPVAYGLLMLVLSAIILAFYNNIKSANQLAIYAYWLIVVGVICLIIEQIREARK